MKTAKIPLTLAGLFLFVFSTNLWSAPQPTDIFREYKWNGPHHADRAQLWSRVTDPNTKSGGKELLPNAVYTIDIDDLADATKAEVCIELLQSHYGTTNKRIRVNGNKWIPIPKAEHIPAGPSGEVECFLTMLYPTVEIPLNQLKVGKNTFEFICDDQLACCTFNWGQWLHYGVTFRVYYSSSKPHPAGSVTSPAAGSIIGENPLISATASSKTGIKQVDFIGYYEDWNYEGDNVWTQWHYIYHYGEIQKHLGTDKTAPYMVKWNTLWVPDQEEPIKIMARIVDNSGMCYMTEAVENITFRRTDGSVKLYKCYDVPEKWQCRAGQTMTCQVKLTENLAYAVAAKMYICSWSGQHAEGIGINNRKIVHQIGADHDLSYDEVDVPLHYLKLAENTPYTYSSTSHHGIEVQWPGMPLKIKYVGR